MSSILSDASGYWGQMPGERTPLFGITDATRKPLNRAASELTQAINALDRHDNDERAAIPQAAGDMARAGNENPGPERDRWAADAARLESIATDLRLARG